MNTAFIVDDEPLARKRIRNLLKDYQSIRLIGESGEVGEATEMINSERPDILFLDIQLKAKKGFQILEFIDYLPLVIFTTAYSEYAVKAFDFYAIDYLLKPFNDERFHRSVSRAFEMINNRTLSDWEGRLTSFVQNFDPRDQSVSSGYLKRIPVKTAEKTRFVGVNDIKYIKASAYYAELYVDGGKHVIRESLSNLADQLDPSIFIRVHRSSIVNINYLYELSSIGFGDVEVKMNDGQILRVSKSYKGDLIQKLGLK